MISTLDQFIRRVESLDEISDAYYVFEGECTPELREEILSFADDDSSEPFRAAMDFLGFDTY